MTRAEVYMRIGFTTTSLRQIKDVEKIVDFACDAGVDCIEWGGDIHVTDVFIAKKAKKLCDDAGITELIYGSYYRAGDNDREEWKRVCDIANALGASSVRVWLGRKDSEETDKETYEAIIEDLKSMCSIASECGITVCPECHGNTFNNNTDAFLKIKKDVSCDNFKTYFQSLYKRKEYDFDRIERTLPFIESVHVSFFERIREQFPNFDGEYIDDLLDKLVKCGFDGNILVEFTWFSYRYGVPSILKRDIKKLKTKLKC